MSDLKLYSENRLVYSKVDHLVIVAGHAIYTSNNFDSPQKNESWLLEPYQINQIDAFLMHIRKGLQIANEDPHSVLVFTGGFTRLKANDQSESQSYFMVAQHFYKDLFESIRQRVTTEILSRDSFENLTFGICRFRELVGHYPQRITVVGFEFKRKRFEGLHRQAIRFPAERFNYVGIDSDEWNYLDKNFVEKGELLNSFLP